MGKRSCNPPERGGACKSGSCHRMTCRWEREVVLLVRWRGREANDYARSKEVVFLKRGCSVQSDGSDIDGVEVMASVARMPQ